MLFIVFPSKNLEKKITYQNQSILIQDSGKHSFKNIHLPWLSHLLPEILEKALSSSVPQGPHWKGTNKNSSFMKLYVES